MVCICLYLWLTLAFLGLAPCETVATYEVSIKDSDYDRQVCSGMWAGEDTFINGANIVYPFA